MLVRHAQACRAGATPQADKRSAPAQCACLHRRRSGVTRVKEYHLLNLQAKEWNDYYVKFAVLNTFGLLFSFLCILIVPNSLVVSWLLLFSAFVHSCSGVAATILFSKKLQRSESSSAATNVRRFVFPIVNAVVVCTLTFIVWIALT